MRLLSCFAQGGNASVKSSWLPSFLLLPPPLFLVGKSREGGTWSSWRSGFLLN